MLSRILPDNPVLTKELRVRMRGSRAYWILFGYLGFMSLILLGSYITWQSSVHAQGAGSSEVAEFGASIFTSLFVTQAFLVLFITPAITSGSLTIEKEQRTFDMLSMTRMPRRSIIVGKLLAAVLFTSLLLISSIPLISICFMFGSIDPGLVVSTYLELLFGSFLIGSMGLMWSSIAKSTTLAVLYTYGSLLILFMTGASSVGVQISQFGGSVLESAVRAVAEPMFSTSFLGLHGVGFLVLSIAGGVLMSAVAMSRLETYPERKAGLLRGLTAALCGLIALAANVWWVQGWYYPGAAALIRVAQPPIGALIVTTALMIFLVPVFATGELHINEIRHYGATLRWGWSVRGLRRGTVASGLPYLLLVTALLLTLFASAFLLAGKPRDFVRSASVSAPATPSPSPLAAGALYAGGRMVQGGGTILVNGRQQQFVTVNGRMTLVPPTSPTPSSGLATAYQRKVGDFPQAAIMLFAFVVGFALLCLLLSVLCRNRWFAWASAMVFLMIVWMAPEQGRAPTFVGLPPAPTVILYYLNPEQAILQMADPIGFRTNNKALPMANQPMWLRVTQVWLAVGSVSLLLTLPLVRRQRDRSTDTAHEAT